MNETNPELPAMRALPHLNMTNAERVAIVRWAAEEVKAAVLREREACAVVCDELAVTRMQMDLSFFAAKQAAAAIRAQGEK